MSVQTTESSRQAQGRSPRHKKHHAKRAGPEDVAIGLRVKGRRLERKMSQTQVAELLGLTFQQLQKYEKGTNRISAARLVRIAAALEVPVGVLLGIKETSLETSLGERMVATRQGCAMAQLWLRLTSTKARQALVDTAELLA